LRRLPLPEVTTMAKKKAKTSSKKKAPAKKPAAKKAPAKPRLPSVHEDYEKVLRGEPGYRTI
jgi:hypothetical protein